MHVWNEINVLSPYMFWRLLRHLQGKLISLLRTVITFCDYIGSQHLNFHVETNMVF